MGEVELYERIAEQRLVIERLQKELEQCKAALRVRTLGMTDERQQDENRASGDSKLGRD